MTGSAVVLFLAFAILNSQVVLQNNTLEIRWCTLMFSHVFKVNAHLFKPISRSFWGRRLPSRNSDTVRPKKVSEQ